MNEIENIAQKRPILSTVRMRFSPQIQPIKETAIDKIIERISFITDKPHGLNRQEIQHIFSSQSGGHAIPSSDIEKSLKRLAREQKITVVQEGRHKLYELSAKTRRELENIYHQAEILFSSVVDRLFKNASEGPSAYTRPFLKFLSIIFSQLGEEYIRVIKDDIKRDEFLSPSSISSALKRIESKFDSIDYSLFENAVTTFFQDSDPDYDAIKWNMAQDYYIAKIVGLDPHGSLLSKEVFGDAIFYLDTNIIIPALEPKDRHHESFLMLTKSCKQLGIKLKVCQISLNELRDWLSYQHTLIEKVPDQIPDEMSPKVRSIFYEIYCEKKRSDEDVNLDDLFMGFESPMDSLKSLFEAELEDDLWFVQERGKSETIRFSKSLSSRYLKMRKRLKRRKAALHDALLLRWLQKLREETHDNIWLITADTSLPGSVPPDAPSRSLAITLDALLQWISPIVVQEDMEDEFASVFAEMLRNRLLPPDRIFDLEDFLVFAEMGMACKELPVEDVEECIRYIKTSAPTLDPSDPAEREKLSYEISKFFADPSRKYRQEISRLEAEKEEIKQEYEGKLGEAFGRIGNLERKSLRGSALRRVGIIGIIFVILEGLAIYIASWYGEGANLVQKILNSWYFLAAGTALTIISGWFILGQKRLEALGWPFTKIFKHEQNTK